MLTLKTLRLSTLVAVLLAGFCAGLYLLDKDVFFGIFWFAAFAALLAPLSARFPRLKTRLGIYALLILLGFVWLWSNDTLFRLISSNINSNPYGDYFIAQFKFRLTLSIFVLKIILETWLTDIRLMIMVALLLFYLLVLPRLFRAIVSSLSSRYFEFAVAVFSNLRLDIGFYLSSSFEHAVVNALLWGLAGFLLQFDNFILMTFLMAICSFIPRAGLLVGALLSLIFVESGLFMIQLGGLFIALASVWFVDHTLFRSRMPAKSLPPALLLLLTPVGYAVFAALDVFFVTPNSTLSFVGLFLFTPFAYLAALIAANLGDCLPLIHRTS